MQNRLRKSKTSPHNTSRISTHPLPNGSRHFRPLYTIVLQKSFVPKHRNLFTVLLLHGIKHFIHSKKLTKAISSEPTYGPNFHMPIQRRRFTGILIAFGASIADGASFATATVSTAAVPAGAAIGQAVFNPLIQFRSLYVEE